jgi:Flp pilus assembly pilin Flp
MLSTIKTFCDDERGLETVEWAIVIGVVTGAMLVVLAGLGGWVDQQYGDLQAKTQPAPLIMVDSGFDVPDLAYGQVVPWAGL